MNKERCEQVLQWIEAHPEHWNQEVWHCGTSHCFAGIAEMMRMELDPSEHVPFLTCDEEYCLADRIETACWLGFDMRSLRGQGRWDRLTAADNTLDDLRQIIRGTP